MRAPTYLFLPIDAGRRHRGEPGRSDPSPARSPRWARRCRGGVRPLVAVLAALLAAVSLGACGDDDPGSAGGTDARGCITDFRQDTDYFPVKSTFSHARNVTISYHQSYQVLTVKQPYPDGRPESYVLVHCGAPAPTLTGALGSAPRIEVPIRSLYSGSTTHLPLLVDLDRTDTLTGVASAASVVNADIRRLITEGRVTEYAAGGKINVEKVVTGRPDVLMTDGTDSPDYAAIRRGGVPVVANAEWLEGDPLGRAEWIKVMAALTGDEEKAGKVFDRIAGDYTAIAAKVSGAGQQPVAVLPGSMYQGTWYMPSGGSYVGKLLADAGAGYPWSGTRDTGSLELAFEAVYAKAGSAPIWLADGEWKTIGDATKEDSRYGTLAATRAGGQVWTNTLVIGPGGGNDYWERGVTGPDLVLGDLVAILHPDLAKDHRFAFYRRLTS
ncbi:ABC transporter substrate-binding protein [Frankia sp. Ag45/Mut15]|uniref:ABC transporter substrate-binding protein n=1 Tax=Frankia umida TaxID=573489 RepID=A0ABT0JUB5_9ACTN|nr:ABC transporter substrate-binding protein [Frankia umida]MCK9875144.1 ABC transporter substrate-binding protein [Frankia umida]